MAKQLKENEIKKLRKEVADEILRLQAAGESTIDAAKNIINKAAAAGMQYSKAAKEFIKAEAARQLGFDSTFAEDAEVIEPTIVGSETADDSQKIGESENVEGVKVEHADDNIKKEQPARKRFKLEEAFNMEKGSDGKTKVSFKLPQNEEEFEDLFTDIAPRIKNNGVKGVVNAVGHTLASGLKAGANNHVTNTFAKYSESYKKTGKLYPEEQAIVDGINNIIDTVFKGFGF